MKASNLAGVGTALLGAIFAATTVSGQSGAAGGYTQPPTSGPAENGSPAWSMAGSFPDPGGRTSVDAQGNVTILPAGSGPREADLAAQYGITLPSQPGCRGSVVCGGYHSGDGSSSPRPPRQRVLWDQTMGYTITYPYHLPEGGGRAPAVALDSKNNLWVYQRAPIGRPQLHKFDANHRLVLAVPMEEIGYNVKAHGMAVDAEDNVWITDANGSTVKKISPDGKLLMTIGEFGRRGDWNEATGQRLLWQPVHLAFGRNGDIYIAGGHGNESPNDVDSDDPTNNIGAARILHLDRNGNFINQWYGSNSGPGKFNSAHGLAVDPVTGDVWIGDREDFRLVIYSGDGKYLRTFAMRNLVCAIQFDPEGNPWMASGQDGQFLKLDRDGRVVGAIGNGMGIGPGQFVEASYWVFDKQGNLYAGDTSVSRVTKMVAPAR